MELADRYVPFPGPAKPCNPADLRDFPKEIHNRIRNMNEENRARLDSYKGKWPEYARIIYRVGRYGKALPLPKKLFPSEPDDFAEPVRSFVNQQLLPVLTEREKGLEKKARNRWPEYPQWVVNAARQYDLAVPGMLPGTRQYWDRYRMKPAQGLKTMSRAAD